LTNSEAENFIKSYVVGDRVRVQSGVFEGLSGVCERVDKDSVVILLSLLSGNRPVEFSKNLLTLA